MNGQRLDAAESIFFQRELEAVDKRMYDQKYPNFKARRLLPTQGGVDEGFKQYTYGIYDYTDPGSGVITDYSKDLKRVDVFGNQATQNIKDLGRSYGYTIDEIQISARLGKPLDAMKAGAARRALEQEIDEYLSLGSTKFGLKGLLSLSNTTTFTPSNKAATGTAPWGTLAAPAATGDEVANDIIGLVSKVVEATLGVWDRFNIVLPIEQYNYANATRLGPDSDTTALKFALSSPFIASIEPWYRCNNAVSGTTDRMCAYPYDPEVVAALVPKEIRALAPQLRNLEYVIPVVSSCGGVVCRYPVAIGYCDGI